jgi:phospholipid/cholesterol/gamma-HCH transport system ATP-binding protein
VSDQVAIASAHRTASAPAPAPAPAPAVSVRNLRMGYGTRVLLQDASFDVHRGEIMVILGGSGCGKSSLMKNIIGLYRPMGGDILIDGWSVVSASLKEKAQLQRKLGIMYQSGALFGSLTVLENVRFPLDEFTDIGLDEKNLTARMLLHQVEMAYAEALMPGELSGGMLKRAGIARAMALGADILMLDEPSAGLDPITAANLDRTILSLRANLGFTFVVVTHELQSIFTIADRAVMLDPVSRSIIAEGNPRDLRDHSTDPRVRQFFNRRPDEAPATKAEA